MLKTEVPSQGLLFSSFLYREDLFTGDYLTDFWEERFGKSFGFRPAFNPLHEFYSKEMGEPLSRKFFVTTQTFPREFLLSAKLQSLDWEACWSLAGKRQVNVDLGFLSLENFLLATTKNYSHRVYIGENIFADLTYHFHQGETLSFPWTYPDYVDDEKKRFLGWCRSYLLQLRAF